MFVKFTFRILSPAQHRPRLARTIKKRDDSNGEIRCHEGSEGSQVGQLHQ